MIDQTQTNEIYQQIDEHQKQFAKDTLERYSGSRFEDFQPCIILTNFPRYVEHFTKMHTCTQTEGAMFKVAHPKKLKITMLDFKIGSPAAALVIDLCAFLPSHATLFLGMCGGLRDDYTIGEYFIPVASIRGDGTSDFYFPSEVPSLANFTIQRKVTEILEKKDAQFHIGITHTTNKRFWEFNNEFKDRLKTTRPQAVEMECATLFTASYSHKLPLGALLLISDLPFKVGGIKTKSSSEYIYTHHMPDHIEKGIQIIQSLDKLKRIKEYRKHVL